MPPKDKVPKRCSKCKELHFYPWGAGCKNLIVDNPEVQPGSKVDIDTGTMASLPDESSAEFLPALKREYARLVDEQSHAMSVHDQFKAMEARFQQRIDDKIEDLSDTLKNTITAGIKHDPAKVDPSGGPAASPLNPIAARHKATDPGDISSTLAALSLSVDKHLSEERKGNIYRLEYFVQGIDGGVSSKNLDHMKLSHREFIHGMVRVLQNMVRENDPRISSYVEHMSFVTSLAAEGGFVNEPFLRYDRYVVDKALRTSGNFEIDSAASSRFFHGGNTFAARNLESRRGGVSGRGRNRGGGRSFWKDHDQTTATTVQSSNPEYSDEICETYNTKFCYGRCNKQHICSICKNKHKAINCTLVTK